MSEKSKNDQAEKRKIPVDPILEELANEAVRLKEQREQEEKKRQEMQENTFEMDAEEAILNEEEAASLSSQSQSHLAAATAQENSDVENTQEIKFISPDENEEIEELKKALEEEKAARETLEKEKQVLYDKFVRLNADFDNFRKRTQRDKEDLRKFAIENLLKDLLTPLDNFERALQSTEQGEISLDRFREGIEMVYRQFLDMLKRYGVERFESRHQPFDYKIHEAISTIPTDDLPPDTIYDEYQAGYMIHDRLLRAAKVVVTKATPNPPQKEEEIPTESTPIPDDETQKEESTEPESIS